MRRVDVNPVRARLAALADYSLSRPRPVLALAILATLGLGAGLSRLELRTAGAVLEPEHDPVIEGRHQDIERFRERRELLLVVQALGPDPSLASRAGMQRLRALDAELRTVAELDPARIRSLASLPHANRSQHRVDLGHSLDRIPEAPAEFERWLTALRARSAATGPLLSADGTRALVAAAVSGTTSAEAAVRAVRSLRDRIAPELGLQVWIGGPLVAESMLGGAVLRDLATLIPLMLGVIVVLLAATVRSPAGVLIPIAKIGLVLLWTFGAMGWLGVPVNLVTTILPVVLMAMCIADELHFLERVEAQRSDLTASERIRAALEEVGQPIILTSFTTAAGFLSFLSASIAPLRSFGLFAAFGMLVALLFTFSLVPAMLVLMPRSLSRFGGNRHEPRRVSRVAAVIAAHPGTAFALGSIAAAALIPGMARLQVGDSWVANFSPTDEIVRADHALNHSFWGSYRLDLVFEGPEGLFTSPSGLRLLHDAETRASRLASVGGVESPQKRLSELAGVIGDERPVSDFSSGQISDLMTLADGLPGGAGLANLMTPDGRTARLRLFVRHADQRLAEQLERELDTWLPSLATHAGARVRLGGELATAAATVESIVVNQLRSIGWAIASLFALLYLFAGSARALICLVPACVAIAALLGAMGWGSIDLGIATSMFASMAVGVGVDFGIHLQHRFRKITESEPGSGAAGIARALAISWRALGWNACVLAGGFLVLVCSALRANHDLGLLLAGAMLVCYAASLLLLPRLLLIGAATAIVLALPIASAPAHAAEGDCPAGESAALTKRMQAVEQAVREKSRLLRMEIEATFREGSRSAKSSAPTPPAKTLWGAVRHDGDATWLLYVFSGPGRLAGTSLLLRDFVAATSEDETWFYLRSFDSFQRLQGAVEQTVVPGSSLTYEDARGFVATARYRFNETEPAESGKPRILACPRTAELAKRLGYGRLYIELDPIEPLVRRIDYRGLGGAPLKVYEVDRTTRFDGIQLPQRVFLNELGEGLQNAITYEYWPPGKPLPDQLFSTNLKRDGDFVTRMKDAGRAAGVSDRLDKEFAEAQAIVDAHDRLWPDTKGGAVPAE